MAKTYSGVDETDGLLANRETSIVDGIQDGRKYRRGRRGAEHTLELTINSDDVVSSIINDLAFIPMLM